MQELRVSVPNRLPQGAGSEQCPEALFDHAS
jgi:hypothetical protein